MVPDGRGENFCRPDFKTNYLITQVVAKIELQDDLPPDILNTVIQTVTGALTGLYTTIIFGVTKAIVAMQLALVNLGDPCKSLFKKWARLD